jgi:biopolymer transport protein TolR
MRRTSSRLQRPIGEINMTPLIDLTFLLLITFVITFPLIQSGIPVNLPRGKAADLPAERRRTITLDLKGNLYLDDRPCTAERLAAEMQELGRRDPDAVVLVRADEGLAYGRVVRILRVLHDAKLARMALVTRPDRQAP